MVSILTSTLAEQGKAVYLIVHRHAKMEYSVSPKVNTLFLDEGDYSSNSSVAKIQRVLKVRNYLKAQKIDYVIPFLDSCMVHTFIASRGLKCKFISTLRNNPYERTKSESRKCDFIASFADANFVQNEMQKNYFSKKIQKKTFVVSNPVNEALFEKEKEYRDSISKIVAFGRLNEQKNYYRLIDAMTIVNKSYPEAKLSIYGEGSLREEILSEIEKKNATGYISLEGRTDDVIGAMQNNDLYVMSSDYEGMPNALMESMAFGMPCVSTDCPTGPKELIGSDERGILAEMTSPSNLADAIIWMINNPAEAAEKGKRARKYMADNFSADKISSKFYEECVRW